MSSPRRTMMLGLRSAAETNGAAAREEMKARREIIVGRFYQKARGITQLPACRQPSRNPSVRSRNFEEGGSGRVRKLPEDCRTESWLNFVDQIGRKVAVDRTEECGVVEKATPFQ